MTLPIRPTSRSAAAASIAGTLGIAASPRDTRIERKRRPWFALLLLAGTTPAQVVDFGNVNPPTFNAVPWGLPGGGTSLHVYSADILRLWGVCAGAQLLDLAVPAGFSGSGTFLAPQCTLAIGHLTVSPPVPGAWANHLDTPVTVHSAAAGPYSFAWSQGSWNSLPGVGAAGFVWDGTRDIGVLVSTAPGTTGTFVTGTAAGLRHYVPVFAATTQTPNWPYGDAMALRLTFAPGGPCATRSHFGIGCYEGAYSFYEQFANLGTFDLQGSGAAPRTLVATPVPSGYQVANGASAWFPPAGVQVLNNGPVPGPMLNDSISGPLALPFSFAFPGGVATVVHAAANGFVLLGPTNETTTTATPSAGAFYSSQPRFAPLWCDLDPALNLPTNPASGIYYDVDPGNQAVYITWLDVGVRTMFSQAGMTSASVQCVLHANGDFEWRYGAITALAPLQSLSSTVLVGWSPGNAQGGSSRLLAPIDISNALPFQTTGPDSWRLAVDSNLPILGTSLTVTVSFVPNLAPIAFIVFADAQLPGLHLDFLGAPDCFAYTTANLLLATVPVTFGGSSGGTGSTSIALPNLQGLLGMPLFSQALAFTLNNQLGLATSNALGLQLGR